MHMTSHLSWIVTQAFAIMEEDLGQPLGAVFSSISERPIAAASLGQVPAKIKSIDCPVRCCTLWQTIHTWFCLVWLMRPQANHPYVSTINFHSASRFDHWQAGPLAESICTFPCVRHGDCLPSGALPQVLLGSSPFIA